jgi:hypothetical protein
MPAKESVAMEEHFAEVTDPRRREGTYPLINSLVIAVCAVICGADDFVAIAEFGRAKKKFLWKFLDLSAGIPSHDRFNAIFRALKPAEFEKALLSWITALHEVTDGQIVAIDGKTLRRSYDTTSSKSAIHMVSAWATANHITLGQVVVVEKSNEITAIPKLLEMLEILGAMVTIDSMGCQTEIASEIVDSGADYMLAVKGNQPTLHDGLRFQHFPFRSAFCGGGTKSLGDRKPFALATRCDISGRSITGPQRTCGCQLRQSASQCLKPPEEQPHEEGGREEQAARRSLKNDAWSISLSTSHSMILPR